MKKKIMSVIIVAAMSLGIIAGCSENSVNEGDRETIEQVSLLQGLTFGDYHGSLPAKKIKTLGDTGIGTFDALNGELIMLEGNIYRASGDGSVEAVDDNETIPFCDVTFFDNDETEELSNVADIAMLKETLNKRVDELGNNRFYMIRIDGNFNEMNVRSELAQTEPYKPLADVLETDQTFFDYSNIEGTVVGLYCPEYMDKLNASGWHFHFISNDRKKGGHILELKFDKAELKWDYTDNFEMLLPDNEMFNSFDLTIDQTEDIKKVETGEDAPSDSGQAVSSDSNETAGVLDSIKKNGVIRVGTAGDYQPMSYLDPETDTYVGFDAELAEDLADAIGVEIEYVKTSWPTLMDDTLAGKFDLAICGITITDARKEKALMSEGYLGNGKTVLCRAEDADKYISLEVINHPEVRVMENPGGLNEKFARENLPDATLIIHDVNQEIPGLVASGEADVMITEIMEAGFYVGQDSRLAAPLIYEPFTNGQLGVLMPNGSEDLLDYVNEFLEKEKANGRIDELSEKYIYRFIAEEKDEAA